MPANYEIRDRAGRLLCTVPSVLDAVELSGVSTAAGSNILTVTSTTGVYPGLAVFCAGIPRGAFINAVRSATELELYASVFNATTGVWTTSAANAQATASATGLKAQAQGFCPVPITVWFAEGCWRNLHSASYALLGPGVGVVPTAGTFTNGVYAPTAANIVPSDNLATTPLKRHEGVPRSVWLFVSTGGHQTTHVISQGERCVYAGPSS